MGQRWIPDDNRAFRDMAVAVAANVAKNPQTYGIDADDVRALTVAVETFRLAMNRKMSAAAREESRKDAEQAVRRIGRVVRANDKISDADKAMLFIYPREVRKTPLEVPMQPPVLRYVGAENEGGQSAAGVHVIEFRQALDLKGRKKPHGAVRVELFVDLVPDGQPIPKFPGQYLGGRPWYLRSYTSSPIRVRPPVPPVPMLVVYWARWADAKGNVGPFSATCRARVEGWGGVAATPLLGAMPEVTVLENDPKYITTITQLRQIEQVTVQQQLLPEPGERPEGEKAPPKQLPPMSDAA
jgi:hypothetical protein